MQENVAAEPTGSEGLKLSSPARDYVGPALLPALRRIPLSVAGAALWIGAMILIAVFADQLCTQPYRALDLTARLLPPSFLGDGTIRHLLGTDELGRDVFSRLLISIRMSVFIAFVATILSAVTGIAAGFASASFRGWVEQVILMVIDVQAAIPFIIIVIAALAFFGNSLLMYAVLMGFHGWERIARISRGLAISALEQGYATAVRDLGASPARVFLVHILPNISSTIIVAMTLNFAEIILFESAMSFLGLGVQPPLTSLGNMVGFGREYIETAPWIMLAPSLVIVLTTLAISVIGDWLRDRLDPTIR